jgi:triosephosphate isomerase (TIM)
MRKKIVAGNWKMNKTIAEATELVVDLVNYQSEFPKDAMVIIAPPALYLAGFELMEHDIIQLAAQNCSDKESGAYTGEISAGMLHSMNINYCIIGHSERRQYYGETNEVVKDKIDACLRNGINPIFCCGEVLAERESNVHFITILHQIEKSLWHLSNEQMAKVVIAYEPVWAIGTGVTATTAQAQEMHAFIRQSLANHFGSEVANATSILYGGSVNALNSGELFAQPDVDGGLVGGASLKAKDFATIIKSIA